MSAPAVCNTVERIAPVCLSQEAFLQKLHLEQKRTERSRRPFMLLLLESRTLFRGGSASESFRRLSSAIAVRETDVKGWYEEQACFGLILTEIDPHDPYSVARALLAKFRKVASLSLGPAAESIKWTACVFPEYWGGEEREGSLHLYRESAGLEKSSAQVIKRCLDLAVSVSAIIVCLPVFLLIAALVKMTSEGPVFFRQSRVGRFGRRFTFLKFRSMYVRNDPTAHQRFVRTLIAGGGPAQNNAVYKITNDPRITPFGRFLRRSSLDELPQLFNVLMGQMSLVGPRPPLPYEVEAYDIWHRRRLLAVKPGITGLWQVTGRSRTSFDEMVRLDLRYASSWSLKLDLKILLQTPRAVISGDGAY